VEAHATFEALLDAADALTVVVPTPAHFEVARAALARGKHLLIEKPITTTLAEADELPGARPRERRARADGHVERFNRAVRAALPYVDAPRFIESDRLAPFSLRGADVAVVLDLMIHDIDLVRTLVGSAVSEVRATGVPVLTPTADIASARLQFASGAVANITSSRVSRERLRKIRIFQQSGYLSLDLGAGGGEFFRMRPDLDLAS
jgi:predicted dehydrogenase